MIINCPFCGKNLKIKLVASFYFCEECQIAVRSEKDMPCLNMDIYGKDWTKYQQKERYNYTKSSFALKQIKKIVGIKDIIDIGCGIGILVNLLNYKGYITDGIDSSKNAIEFAKLYNKGRFYLSSLDNFKPRHHYDLAIATQMIEHLRKPDDFLLRIENLLKTGGYLYLETPNLYSWSKKSIWRRRIGGMFYGRDHRIVYTCESLTNLIEKRNFSVCMIFTKTFSPTIFAEMVNTVRFCFFKKGEEGRNYLLKIASKNSSRFTKRTLSNIYKKIVNSFVIKLLLFIPNKISEINDKGNQIVVIAKRKS